MDFFFFFNLARLLLPWDAELNVVPLKESGGICCVYKPQVHDSASRFPSLLHTVPLTFGLYLTFICLKRTRFITSQKPAGPDILEKNKYTNPSLPE